MTSRMRSRSRKTRREQGPEVVVLDAVVRAWEAFGRAWKRTVLKKIEDTFPWVCVWVGVAWLAYLMLQSSLTAPMAVLALGMGLWARTALSRLRSRGGPIALLPPWAQSLLLETRPLDAMSAVAVVVDAQKGIGLLVHLLAALRLDERERATFVAKLPVRVRNFVLAPGLLHVMPRSLRACVTWGDSFRDLTEQHAREEEPPAAPGDAPRAEPDDEPPPRTPWSQIVRRRLSREALSQTSFSEIVSAVRDCVPYLRRPTDASPPPPRANSVARAVAEFNPWPTLLRVVTRRCAAWFRSRLTLSVVSTTTLCAGGALGLQLAVSPASRRVAAASARLGAVVATSSALVASVAAFAVLHADTFFGLTREAPSSNFSPRRARWARRQSDLDTQDTLQLARSHSEHSLRSLHTDRSDDGTDDRSDDSSSSGDRASDEPGDNDLSPWPAAAAMFCAVVCARSLRVTSPADWISPFAAQLAKRLFEAFLRLKTPFE